MAFKKALQQSSGQTGQYPQSVILFSPASKSFEKFKNEYDRGEQFNNLIKNILNQTLIKAYKIIFGQEPLAELKDWEVATRILHKWSVPKIGKTWPKECIFAIVNHIKYPSEATTHLIVGEAEEKE